MELWELIVSVVECKETKLLRFTHRTGKECFDSYPYRDIDIAFKMSKEELNVKAKNFIEDLGFNMPLPIGINAAYRIFSFIEFPAFETWIKFRGEESYPPEKYKKDSTLWWKQRLLSKTHNELFRWVLKSIKSISYKSEKDRMAYQLQIAMRFEEEIKRLNLFYGQKEIPEQITNLLKIKNESATFSLSLST